MTNKSFLKIPISVLTAIVAFFALANDVSAEVAVEHGGSRYGVIKGVVRDNSGKPISRATVSFFRVGTSKLLKQVTASSRGRFFTRIVPGTYTILAIAQGFNPVTLKKVKVNRASELVYGFKLERSGSGKTLPEKRVDRSSPKWRIRAASRRSIYQNNEGELPVKTVDNNNSTAAANEGSSVEQRVGVSDTEEKQNRKGQTVVESYVASIGGESFKGLNFATLQPLGEDAEIVFAGQIGSGKSAPKRFETTFSFRPTDEHRVNLRGSVSNFGTVELNQEGQELSQVSVQALDQWKVREGVIVVVGLDYSRYLGAGNDSAISPRLGFQFDVDSKTRVRSAYTTQTEPRTWQRVIDLEDTQVLFREPVVVEDVVVKNDKPVMSKNRRLEFGIERILDDRSSVEANVFFDAVTGRGVGLANLPFDSLNGNQFSDIVASQHGKAQGLRVVYSRRLNRIFSAKAGYSFGNGQQLSPAVLTEPDSAFERDFFQTVFGELNASLKTGTNVRTIFRLSPKATVFAIDPFQGRLAIYDPGLSIMVTQDLPVWGLPIDAEAVVDAKNIMDFRNGIAFPKGILTLNSQRRVLRGGILVRF